MDQIKIGRFIAECRKKNGFTQMQLAEKLNITDRAISKWENGKTMPDSSIMLELCDVLGISVNDLLNGEIISLEKYNKKTEEQLIALIKEKEIADKRLLKITYVFGTIVPIMLLLATVLSSSDSLPPLVVSGIFFAMGIFSFVCPFVLAKIQQTTGYYRCKKCGHTYVPSYATMFSLLNLGNKTYTRCPKCEKRSWHKKVFTKE